MLPRRREEDLVTETVADELLVYDLQRHRAYCLNPAAALVWRHCDGATSEEALAERLSRELELPESPELVQLALRQLQRAHLLETALDPERAAQCSRRELARKLGLAGGLAALVPAITAPTAASAASALPNGSRCRKHGEPCSSDCCCGATGSSIGICTDPMVCRYFGYKCA